MSERIKKHLPLFELLHQCGKTQMKSILQSSSSEQIKALVELVYNIQFGTINVPEEYLSHLKKKKSVIRQLTSKGVGLAERKSLLVKNSALISTILKFSLGEVKKIVADG